MSRIAILGNGSVELSAALALVLSQNDIILCGDEIMSDPICINIPVDEEPVFSLSKRCNEWRGGSRKKGGKIGYRRS